MPDSGGQTAYAQQAYYILEELKRLNACSDKHDEKFDKYKTDMALRLSGIEKEISALKVKSGVWGFAAGLVPVAMMLIIQFLK